jgi:hypothetical protein
VHPAVHIDSYGDRVGTEAVMQGSDIAGKIFGTPIVHLISVRISESDNPLTVQEERGKFVSSDSILNTQGVIDIGMASQEMVTLGLQTGHNNSASGSRHHASVLGSDEFFQVAPRHSLMEEHHIREINNSPILTTCSEHGLTCH